MNIGTLLVSLQADTTGLTLAEAKVTILGKSLMKLGGLMGAAFTVEKIYAFTKQSMVLAASMQGVQESFEKISTSTRVFDDLKQATRGTIDNFNLMKLAIKAENFKIPFEDLTQYMKFATDRAIQMKGSFEDIQLFADKIIVGVGRKFSRSLAPLGLVTKDVTEAFKTTGGFMKLIETESQKMGDISDNTSVKIGRYSASVVNLKLAWGSFINNSNAVNKVIDNTATAFTKLSDSGLNWFQKLRMGTDQYLAWKDAQKAAVDEATKTLSIFSDKQIAGGAAFIYAERGPAYIQVINERTKAYIASLQPIQKVDTLLKNLNQQLTDEQIALENTSELDKESIKFHNDTIKSLQLRIDAMKGINKVLDESIKKQEELGNIWKNFEGELTAINTIYSVFGDEAELHKKTLNEYTRTYEDLIRKGTNPLNEDMLNLIDNIRTLQDVVNADEAMKKMKEDLKDLNKIVLVASRSYQWKINAPEGYSGATSGMGLRPIKGAKIPKFVETEDIDTIGKLTNGLIHQREVVNGLSNSFRELFSSLNIGFTHATSIFQKLVNTMLQGVERIASEVIAKKIIDALFPATKLAMTTALTASQTAAVIAHTTATTASIPVIQAASIAADDLAYSEAAAAGAWVPFPGNLAAIAAGVAAVTSALAASKIATVVTKLARGGEVPPGYPNDTFPALLSSGEKVLPAGVGGLSMQPAGVGGKVLIEFKNGSLEGYLDYNQRKLNSYR
jgi:hypothetical protein